MHNPLTDEVRVTPPSICELSQIELAHATMQQHLCCRAEHCAWKQVAYHTLVHFHRVEPPRLSPRERAHCRGVEFPAAEETGKPFRHGVVPAETFRQVLAGLNELANGLYPTDTRVE